MLRRLFGHRRDCDVLFLCASSIDEVWIRTTVRACRARGISAQLAVCDEGGPRLDALDARYRSLGVPAHIGATFVAAANIRCRIALTASSGVDRGLFPTSARALVHMPHSLASLHMIYPPDTFDGYDVLFAAGPHHAVEFRAITASRGLANRRCFPAGYGKFDVLAETKPDAPLPVPHVLIASSWGRDNLLDRCGVALADSITAKGYAVTVRPHPLFQMERAAVLDELRMLATRRPRLQIESPWDGDRAILHADVMIGDYSGASFEFAVMRRRPVVSVDVGLKVVNDHWQQLGLTPVEVGLRPALGPVVAPDVDDIIAAVEASLATDSDSIGDAAIAGFSYGRPGEVGVRSAALLHEMLAVAQ